MNSELQRSQHIELITIGKEILDGRIVDTNSVEIARSLRVKGLSVRFAQRIDDRLEDIVSAMKLAASRSHYVLVTGGLGPTSDDITMEAFAKFLGKKLVENRDALKHLNEYLALRSLGITPAQKKQIFFPEGSSVLANPNGTACGAFNHTSSPADAQFFLMPGVPSEMLPMLENEIFPKLPTNNNIRQYRWATQFVPEAMLQDRLQSIADDLPDWIELNFRTRFPENHIALFADCKNERDLEFYREFCERITKVLKEDAYFHGPKLKELHEVVVEQAIANEYWIAAVESCTGGQISAALTSVPGSSGAVFGTWTTYHNRAKVELGVDKALLEAHGAVSKEVAEAMANAGLAVMKNAMPAAKNLICVSTTGIAGPTGGSDEKPVGLCFVAIATFGNTSGASTVGKIGSKTSSERIQARAHLSREKYQQYFTQKALDQLRIHVI